MNTNTLPFLNDDDVQVLVRQLCNCAKLGKDYFLKSHGDRVSSSSVRDSVLPHSSEEERFIASVDGVRVDLTIDYLHHHIDVSRYDEIYGRDSSEQAYSNFERLKGGTGGRMECSNDCDALFREIVQVGVALFAHCLFATDIPKVDGTYDAPSLESYAFKECRFTQRENNGDIVIPKTVLAINRASFMGPLIQSGYNSALPGSPFWEWDYLISDCGIKNVWELYT